MTKVEIKNLNDCELELSGEIAADTFDGFWNKAVSELGQETEISGFRKGHAPEAVLVKQLGEEKILYEMAQLALSEEYPKILEENKIEALGRPEIAITKIAKNNPLGFKIKVYLTPKIELADFKKVAAEIMSEPAEDLAITDEEVSKVIEDIRKSRAIHNHKEGEEHKDGDEILPELNDDFAKSVGNFQTLAELQEKIRTNLGLEKEQRAKDKRRVKIVEEVIKQSKISIPDVLVEYELDKMLAELKGDLANMGLNYEDYLKHLKKSEEDLIKNWRGDAERRVKFGLVLSKIAETEKLEPDTDKLEQEVKHLLEHYKEADPVRAKSYIAGLLTNEKVFEFLESQK